MPSLTACFGASAGVAFALHWMNSSFWLIIIWVRPTAVCLVAASSACLAGVILAVAPTKRNVLCFVFPKIFFSLIFRRDANVFAVAALAGLFPSTAHPHLFPAVASTSIVGCASPFVLLSSSIQTLVAPLFLVVEGVTVAPASAGR